MGRPAEVDVLPEGYRDLFDRARERLEADERVRALWLAGSLARGTADRASDLDLIVTVADEAFEEFAASWRSWLAEITPTVLAAELPFAKGSFHSVTPDFERFDVVVEAASTVPTTFFRTRIAVFDPDGLAVDVPPPEAGTGPSIDAVEALVTEYFRISAVETILLRQDWLLAREHLHVVASLTYRLFVEANAPLPAMGVKQWSSKLTPTQQAAMATLPTTAQDAVSLGRAHLEAATLFVTNAEALLLRLGGTWPDDLERAAAGHLRRHLGVEQPYPRRPESIVV